MRARLSVNQFVAAVAGSAAAALVVLAATDGAHVDTSLLLMLTIGFGLTVAFPLRNALSSQVEGLELQEAVILPALVLLPAWPTTAAFAAVAAIALAARRRGFVKAAFNVAQWVLQIAAAYGVMALLEPDGDRLVGEVLAAIAATAVGSVVNFAAVSGVVAIAAGSSVRAVSRGHLTQFSVVWIGNVGLGVLLGVVAYHEPSFLPVVLVPAVMMQLSYRSIAERSAEGRRLERLGRAEVAMAAATDADALGHELASHAAAMLSARSVEVTIDGAGGRTVSVDGDTTDHERPPRGVGELEKVIDVAPGCSLRVVVTARRNLDPFDEQDVQVLDTLVLHAGEVLARLWLFDEVHREGQRTANILASSSDGIFSVDGAQRVQAWNPAMERITGLTADRVIGGPCTVFAARDEQGGLVCPDTCPGRCGFHGEPVPLQVTTPAGDVRWLNCTYSPMPGGGYVVVARDVTAQKEVEDLKADFLATVSHELRTPLTPIKGFLSTLRDRDGEFDSDQRVHLYEVMQRQADRLERLVTDLLDATSMDQQASPLFLSEQLHWGVAVAHAVDLFQRQEPDREIVLDCPVDLPDVVADEQRAEQVLSNLLSNAAKYSPSGGRITVTLAHVDGEVRTTVSDTGPGIEPDHRDRVFERFTRLGDYRTRTSGGAGLGLFIAKRLVEGMGGSISVDEGAEGGAAFTFTLPVVEHAADRR